MTALRFLDRSPRVPGRLLWRAALAALFAFVAACGSGDAPPPPDLISTPTPPPTSPAPIPPTITQQPANVTTMPGQSASFSVTATGTAPLAYQWQRNGVPITGATSASYTLATTALTDSGATFVVVVSNVAGSATSNAATLTVSPASPVLSISPQPTNQAVVAGAMASFTVGGTCSSGTLTIQWQRLSGTAFADIAGATSATYSFMAAAADNGAQFRAVLSCSGASTTASSVATLTVSTPSSVTLSALPVTGLRDQAPIGLVNGIDPAPGGGWDFTSSNVIRHLSADLSTITLVAGAGSAGSADGPAATATFNTPFGLVHDASGNIYVADTQNQTIRRIGTDGTVSTIAGSVGMYGFVDGTGSAAQFSSPSAITLGPDGDLYVADKGNGAVRRVTTAGVVTTYAGSGTGFADGPPATAKFNNPNGLVAAANGDLYVADFGNARLRLVVRSGNVAGSVATFAGSGSFAMPGVDGIGIAAGIPLPNAIALRGSTLYVFDGTGTIRAIDVPTAVVTTIAGAPLLGSGYADGPPGAGRFNPQNGGIAIQPTTGLVVADLNGLRTVDASGSITTIATNRFTSSTPGTGVLAQLPFFFDTGGQYSINTSIVTDPTGQVVVSETGPDLVRRVGTSGAVTLVAGLAFGPDIVDGKGSAAQLTSNGSALAVAPDGTLYTSDGYGVSRIATDGTASFFAGSRTMFGAADGPPGTALFNSATGIAVGPSGDVFVSDGGNHAIRRVDSTGNTTTYAGMLGVTGSVDGPRLSARFQSPGRMAFAPDGTLYVIDNNGTFGGLRRIAPDGTVSSISSGVQPIQVAVDPNGTIYIAVQEAFAQSIGTINPSTGTYTRIIGTGTSVVLGNVAPSLGQRIGSIYMHGTKQVVVVSGGELLLLTLP